jgi:AraC-like DNA-binding protein
MRYITRQPGPLLRRFIEHFWQLSDEPTHGQELVVPSGTVELVVNLERDEFRISDAAANPPLERRYPGAIVSGCYKRSFGIDTRDHAAILGVHFRPGGAMGLLGAPPGALSDQHVALADLWGHHAAELRERLCAAGSIPERFDIIEHALVGRLQNTPRLHGAIESAIHRLEQPGVAIGDVAEALQLSRRRFIEIFTRDVGMTPKRYARVRRFQRALSCATSGPPPAWAAVAQECGYYDQAHLCREWSEITGLSPSQFVSLHRTPTKTNHVAVATGGQIRPIQPSFDVAR